MNKKIMIAFVLFTLLTSGLSSTFALAKEIQNETTTTTIPLVASEISINTSSQISETLTPSVTKTVGITVNFKLDMGSLAKWFFTKRRIGRLLLFGPSYILKLKGDPKAVVNLSVECPTGCTATLDKESVEFAFNNVFETANAQLTFSINKTVPALESSDITIKANFNGFGGIKESSNMTTVSFRPAYISEITYDVQKEINISSTNETIIPINITNNGNGDATVEVKLENSSGNLNMSIDTENITIPINKTKQVNLIITPTKNFENETINVKLIPKSTYSGTDVEEKYLQGENVSFSIALINTQPKEKEQFPLFELLIIAIVIIIIILMAAIILFRKKKQQ